MYLQQMSQINDVIFSDFVFRNDIVLHKFLFVQLYKSAIYLASFERCQPVNMCDVKCEKVI